MGKRDYVRMARIQDKKLIAREKEEISLLQRAGQYPTKYDFPLTLQFELTTHCNVKCKHCYNNSGECNSTQDRMTPEKWKAFSRYLVQRGGIFQCVMSGGEPLLFGDELFEIMDILHEDGTFFLLITNGYLLTEDKVKRLAKYRYKWLQVSIDGADAAFHDEFRQRKGSWERAVNGAYMVSKEGIPLTIAHSVSPGNLEQVDAMCELAYALGAGSIILGEINSSGRSVEKDELLLNTEQRNYLYGKIEELSGKYGGRMSVQRSSSTRNQLLRYMNTPNSGAIIRPNGDIRLDCMTPFLMGNVLDDDFETLWKKKSETCWQDPRVIQYVEGFTDTCDVNADYRNYFDKDTLL